MSWSAVPFGKHEGKMFPEIIVRDPDWFFWMVPKLYGKLADEPEPLARKGGAIKISAVRDFAGFCLSKPVVFYIRDGQHDFRTWISGGRFSKRGMTSEPVAS